MEQQKQEQLNQPAAQLNIDPNGAAPTLKKSSGGTVRDAKQAALIAQKKREEKKRKIFKLFPSYKAYVPRVIQRSYTLT